MPDLPSRRELQAIARAALLDPTREGLQLSAKEADRRGSTLNLHLAAIALVANEVVSRAASELAGCFEDTATGQKLDRRIMDTKTLPRLPAAPAVVPVTLTRPTFAAGAVTLDGGIPGSIPTPARFTNQAGITYFLLSPVSFGAADLGPHTVDAQAELAGTAYEVDELQSWNWASSVADPTIEIANATFAAGAADEEQDDAYKTRSKDFFPSLEKGVLGAIDFGLRSVAGIASASVDEVVNVDRGLPACWVTAFVVDSLGRSNSALAARGQRALLRYRALGIPVVVESGVEQLFNVVWQGLSVDTSIIADDAAALAALRRACVAAAAGQRSGQKLERATMFAAAKSIRGLTVPDSALLEPALDLEPATPASAFRTRESLVTIVPGS